MTTTWRQEYGRLTDFLGRTLGPDYEVVLYDLAEPEAAVLAIANGHVSGRTVGAPLPPAVLQQLQDVTEGWQEYRIHVTSMTDAGKLLRTSMYTVRAESDGRPVGVLCIHFDDSRYRDLSERLLRLRHPDAFVDNHFAVRPDLAAETPTVISPLPAGEAAANRAEAVLADVLREVMAPPERLTYAERRALVRALQAREFFLLKGAVRLLASRLGCAPATVYRYLTDAAA